MGSWYRWKKIKLMGGVLNFKQTKNIQNATTLF